MISRPGNVTEIKKIYVYLKIKRNYKKGNGYLDLCQALKYFIGPIIITTTTFNQLKI